MNRIINDLGEYFVAMRNGTVIFSTDPDKAMLLDQSQVNGLLGNIYQRVPADVTLYVEREIWNRRAA